MSSSLIESMIAAVEASPQDLPLRRHLAELLIAAGRGPEAVTNLAVALQSEPAHPETQAMMARALGAPAAAQSPAQSPAQSSPQSSPPAESSPESPVESSRESSGESSAEDEDVPRKPANGMDWRAYEQQFEGSVPPRFARGDDEAEPIGGEEDRVVDIETSGIRLADVGGISKTRSCARCTARACVAACCSTVRPAAGRRSWRGRWPARWAPGSPPCRWWTC
jgi:hypothetical protein